MRNNFDTLLSTPTHTHKQTNVVILPSTKVLTQTELHAQYESGHCLAVSHPECFTNFQGLSRVADTLFYFPLYPCAVSGHLPAKHRSYEWAAPISLLRGVVPWSLRAVSWVPKDGQSRVPPSLDLLKGYTPPQPTENQLQMHCCQVLPWSIGTTCSSWQVFAVMPRLQ